MADLLPFLFSLRSVGSTVVAILNRNRKWSIMSWLNLKPWSWIGLAPKASKRKHCAWQMHHTWLSHAKKKTTKKHAWVTWLIYIRLVIICVGKQIWQNQMSVDWENIRLDGNFLVNLLLNSEENRDQVRHLSRIDIGDHAGRWSIIKTELTTENWLFFLMR